MIVTRLDGGLGNQMFQYAFGSYLANKHATQLVLDLSSYQTGPQHGYMLDRFQISATSLDHLSSQRIPKRYRTVASNWLPDWLSLNVLRRVKERPFGFDVKYIKSSDNSYLVGYWQSEKFFPGIRDELLKQFTPVAELSHASQRVIGCMQSAPSISLHIRRGDYVSNAETAQIYEQLSLEYYQTSLQWFVDQHERVKVFVFSNDLPWCREHLRLSSPTHFVDHTRGHSAHEDLVMMSHAACNVIANSTFSWWAAYLNNRDDRTACAPAPWFRPGTLNDEHLLSPAWQVVDVAQSDETMRGDSGNTGSLSARVTHGGAHANQSGSHLPDATIKEHSNQKKAA